MKFRGRVSSPAMPYVFGYGSLVVPEAEDPSPVARFLLHFQRRAGVRSRGLCPCGPTVRQRQVGGAEEALRAHRFSCSITCAQIHLIARPQNRPHHVIVRHPFRQIRRHQHRLPPVTSDEVLWHHRMVINPPDVTPLPDSHGDEQADQAPRFRGPALLSPRVRSHLARLPVSAGRGSLSESSPPATNQASARAPDQSSSGVSGSEPDFRQDGASRVMPMRQVSGASPALEKPWSGPVCAQSGFLACYALTLFTKTCLKRPDGGHEELAGSQLGERRVCSRRRVLSALRTMVIDNTARPAALIQLCSPPPTTSMITAAAHSTAANQ